MDTEDELSVDSISSDGNSEADVKESFLVTPQEIILSGTRSCPTSQLIK